MDSTLKSVCVWFFRVFEPPRIWPAPVLWPGLGLLLNLTTWHTMTMTSFFGDVFLDKSQHSLWLVGPILLFFIRKKGTSKTRQGCDLHRFISHYSPTRFWTVKSNPQLRPPCPPVPRCLGPWPWAPSQPWLGNLDLAYSEWEFKQQKWGLSYPFYGVWSDICVCPTVCQNGVYHPHGHFSGDGIYHQLEMGLWTIWR